jgi:hypothetical protein
MTAARDVFSPCVASQLLGLALCRYILKIPPVVALSREEIIAQVGATLQRYVIEQDGQSPPRPA